MIVNIFHSVKFSLERIPKQHGVAVSFKDYLPTLQPLFSWVMFLNLKKKKGQKFLMCEEKTQRESGKYEVVTTH